jgi:hypothetical protein
MRENIENLLKVTCEDIDLTTITDIEFYVKQSRFFGCYTPHVVSANEMIVKIPFEDAKKMVDGEAKLQFAFRDAEGNPRASNIVTKTVGELLKEMGYAPI